MRLEEAEQIAKTKMREYLRDREAKLRTMNDRFVFQAEKKADAWVIIVGVFPKEALVAPPDQDPKSWWDDREEVRARDWLYVTVDRAGGTRVEEVAELDALLG